MYSALNKLNGEDVKIVTVEDPVEYRLSGITQVQVNSQIGLSFASGIRSILRQDPNIIMVGEIRDSETAEIAVRASLTGHLVLSTIHTNSAISTISRMIDMGVDAYLIASSLSCVVAQRLVRRVCKECSQSIPAKEEEIQLFEEFGVIHKEEKRTVDTGGYSFFRRTEKTSHEQRLTVRRGTGCGTCHKSGYHGRVAIHEILVIDEALRRLIAQNRPFDELKQHVMNNGFTTMMMDGLTKVLDGITTLEEVHKAVAEE